MDIPACGIVGASGGALGLEREGARRTDVGGISVFWCFGASGGVLGLKREGARRADGGSVPVFWRFGASGGASELKKKKGGVCGQGKCAFSVG